MEEKGKPDISVVIPVYGSDDVLPELHRRVALILKKITPAFEIIFVNDASPDNAWQVIKKLAGQDKCVRGINLSRNFGQYPAITAGLAKSKGEWVVVMDCDLQDQPEEIEKMYQKAQEGFFVVVGSRQKRHDSFIRSFVSRVFYATLSYLTGRHQDRTEANFGIYHRKVIDAILALPEHMRYFSVMRRWVGFKTASVPVEHGARKGGKSGYSLRKLLSLAADIILAYSDKPLRLIIKFGLVVTFLAVVYLTFVLLQGLLGNSVIGQFEILVGSLWLIFGMISTILGLIALYLGKTFEEVKKRPIYFVEEEV
ncbi:glycosyltransferase family 2 protein [Patescibacteria group bacterium]|nr:glycosyltransferase family 2 protein [Patescibacteria group bacterium]